MTTYVRIALLALVFVTFFGLAPFGRASNVLGDGLASVSCSSLPSGSSSCAVTLNTNIRAGGSIAAVLQTGGAVFAACAAQVAGQTCMVSSTGGSVTLTCGTVDCPAGSQFTETVQAAPAVAQQQFFMITSAGGTASVANTNITLPLPPPARTTLTAATTNAGRCVNGSVLTSYGCTSTYAPFYGGGTGYYPYGLGYSYPYSTYVPSYGYGMPYPLIGSGMHYCFVPGFGSLWVQAGTIVRGTVC